MYTIEYYSVIKILPFVTWVDLKGNILSEISQIEYCMTSHMESKKTANS